MADAVVYDHLARAPSTAYCLVSAAHRFSLPIEGLLGMLLTEGGKVGQVVKNKNGSRDFGPMQINSIWLRSGSPLYGFVTEDQLRDDLCVNIHSAAWILSSNIKATDGIWAAIGRYHAPYNQALAWKYQLKVSQKVQQAKAIIAKTAHYQEYIDQFFNTKEKS